MNDTSEVILTTCPRDCYDSCGIAVVKRDGVVSQVRGDPAHPVSRGTLCPKCSLGYNHEWRDPAIRLTRPLRRTGRKGEGRFEPVSWEAAAAAIAGRLTETVARAGPHTILSTHYTGTISLLASLFPMRFFNRLGAAEVTPDTICNMAGHAALGYMYGTSLDGFDPRTVGDAACILIWGANPAVSGPHVFEHWLQTAPGTVVVVDPIRTATARAAHLHLQPYPGSDAALAFAMLHVMRREGLLDRPFIAAHTLGWDELEGQLADCTPEWAERTTGVPAAKIEQAARLYARGPSLLWLGQGLQRQRHGGNVMRACAVLPAATGNLCKPGAGFLYLNWNLAGRGIDDTYLAAPHLRTAAATAVSQMDLAAWLEDAGRSQALLCWNINIAASNPQQARLRAALAREDLFTVVLDLFQTDTADYADYVLPAASFLEFDDLVASYFMPSLSAQVKAMEPPGEALPNQEIFRRLSRAMGYSEPELFETDAQVLAELMQRSGLGRDFAALAEVGTIPVPAVPAIQFDGMAFPTPSGKVEIASARAERDGHPRVPRPTVDPRPAAARLRLLSPASPWHLNDSFGNIAKAEVQAGPASVCLHPEDAAARGLQDGSVALLRNDTGRLRLRVALCDDVPRGVALTHKGRWPRREGAGANVNVLNPGEKSDMGESTCVHGTEVTVEPAGP